jgi:hypothetical protein
MARMPRTLLLVILALGFSLASSWGHAMDAADGPVLDTAPFDALAQIVVAGEDKAWGTGIQLDTYVDELVYAVKPEHGWTPRSPLWNEVAARVKADVASQPDLFLQIRRQVMAQGYARSYAQALTPKQAKDITTLYQSGAGQKYLAFSADLLDLYLEIMRKGRDEGEQGPIRAAMFDALKSPSSQDERVLLAASTRYLVSEMGGVRSAPAGLVRQRVAMKTAASASPTEWNALFARYRQDMDSIVRVANDPLTQLEMDHSNSYGGPPIGTLTSLQPSLASWRAFYWTAEAKQPRQSANP